MTLQDAKVRRTALLRTRPSNLSANSVKLISAAPAVAAECTSIKGIDTSRSRWQMLRSQPAKEADREKTCCAYATLFHEASTLRQVATTCTAGERNLAVLDSEINAFNNLMATKCGG